MIVEFEFNIDASSGWKWNPLKVRYDKTSQLRNGEKNYGNPYVVSNENWNWPANEVISLMKLFRKTLMDEINLILENDIKFKVIGDKTKLDILTRKKIDDLESKTKNNKNMQLILALSYGSRQEIITAVNNLLQKNKNKVNLDEFIM